MIQDGKYLAIMQETIGFKNKVNIGENSRETVVREIKQ